VKAGILHRLSPLLGIYRTTLEQMALINAVF